MWCLLVLAMLCRAVIPAGYMPGGSGSATQGISITLCTAANSGLTLAVLPDTKGSGQPAGDHQDAAHVCAFGSLSIPGLLSIPALSVAFGFVRQFIALVPGRTNVVVVKPLPGPPLGSRAPPFYLG
jgi:hypothetical protein